MGRLNHYRLSVWVLLGALSSTHCNERSGGRSGTGTSQPGNPSTTTGGGTGGTLPDEVSDKGKGTATALEFGTIAILDLYTKEAAENTCVPFVVKAVNGTAAAEDVPISLELQSSAGMTDTGTLTPAEGVSDATGELSATYCSGESEGKIVIVAKHGNLSVNSSKISVAKKPVYKFTYLRSDTDPLLTPSDEKENKTGVVYLNLLDSGPQDCTHLYFKLTRSETPVVGESLVFSTQVDYPKGAKLAKRADPVQTQTDAITNKKYSYTTSISSGAGEFAVPVCAGVSLGTLLISATFTDEEERTYTVKSPVVRITAGLTNYINLSLTFDAMNARTMKAYFNTNSSYELPVTVQLGARQDGTPITEYPVGVASEVGRVKIENGGIPDTETGSVKFKLQSLHLVNNYPYPVTSYTGYPLAQTRCEPQNLASWGTAQAASEVSYVNIRKNWRSTVVYSIRGQEHYHDANRNGVYDAGGDGFWDKNQNGIYDSGDVITYDAGGDSAFNALGEWFIDLPTPFVDVDEDGAYTAGRDLLIGDEYQAPNGKRDADALLWKYEYFPVSMGPSTYGLQRYRIQTADYTLVDNPVTMPWGTSYEVFGINTIDASKLWGGAVTAAMGNYRSLIFAHDLCGNLLPGGTKLSLSFVASQDPGWGPRTPTGHFYVQPGDQYLEPSRHLLRDAAGGTSTINFNAVDHPTAANAYPVVNAIEIPACTNLCTGAVNAANPGISCDGWSGYAGMKVEEPALDTQGASGHLYFETPLSFGPYNACNCVATATATAGVCNCPTGTSFDSGTASCI